MILVVEQADSARVSYGKVHRQGCRDVRDGESIGEVTAWADLAAAITRGMGWDRDDAEARASAAPCVKLA